MASINEKPSNEMKRAACSIRIELIFVPRQRNASSSSFSPLGGGAGGGGGRDPSPQRIAVLIATRARCKSHIDGYHKYSLKQFIGFKRIVGIF